MIAAQEPVRGLLAYRRRADIMLCGRFQTLKHKTGLTLCWYSASDAYLFVGLAVETGQCLGAESSS